MKKIYLLFLLPLLCVNIVSAQCTEPNVTRVMLIGDSWAAMMNTDNTINSVFQKWGHSNYKFYTNAVLAENGTKTTDFLQQNRLDEIETQLLAHPDIDFVHLSIGGNDVLNQWHKTWSQAKTDSLLDSVYSRIVQIIDHIKVVRPDIDVVWSGYTYANFGEIIGEMAPFQSTHPFYGTWNGMGQPNFVQLNNILNYFSESIDTLVANDPQVHFVKATALMQYVFGQTTNLSVSPGGTYAPFTAPLPYGFIGYPSPKAAMRNYVIFRDCFHLSADGFSAFIDYQTQKYYQKALMDDQYFISSGSTLDGSVSSQGNVSSDLKVGNLSGEDFSTVLNFNTTVMPPDTGALSASLFLRREALSGTNPISNNMQITIKSGFFGATVDVEASDYGATGDATVNPCQFGTANANGGWIRLELPAAVLPYINASNATQFIISAPGSSGLVTFTGAADPEFAPVLNITYGPQFVGMQPHSTAQNIIVYPNPTSGLLIVDAKNQDITDIEVYDLPGRLVMTGGAQQRLLDLSSLIPGMYVVKIKTPSGALVRRVIKR